MNPRTEPLPFEGHVQAGRRLMAMRADLVQLGREVGRRYHASSKVHVRFALAQIALDQLRNELDEQLQKDHPVEANSDVYYGDARETVADGQ